MERKPVNHKIAGCCSLCDTPCFEVLARWDEGELMAGEPKALGAPNEGTTRIAFILFHGGYTEMTFCGACAKNLTPDQYRLLWNKNLAGYMRAARGDAQKFSRQFDNGLLCELGRTPCKERSGWMTLG